jgi:predicted DNA-binding transcriptional regulator AlpA
MDLNTIIRSDNAEHIQLVVNAKDLRDLLDGAIAFAKQQLKEANEPEYYTREELADKLHVSQVTLLSYRSKGWLPEPVKIGGRVLYDKAGVRDCLDKLPFKVANRLTI